MKVFTETGQSDILDKQSQGNDGIFDEFTGPPVPTGVGISEALIFMDGNHSKVR